jgi:hypothetical protein
VRHLFSARAESEDGAVVAWSGYTEGYESGAEEQFDITIENETAQSWRGRYCLQLLAGQSHRVLATLEQQVFTLEPGVSFSEAVTVRFAESLEDGAYGLSLAVRRPSGSLVDLVPIQIGDVDEVRRPTTRQDLDASLVACPPVEAASELVELAKSDLARRLGIGPDEIEVQSVEPTEFPGASLGVSEPGKTHAQVVTPGYVIELNATGRTYRYHAGDGRVVPVPAAEGQPPTGHITIEGVEVTTARVAIRGKSTLPEGTCVSAELWADGELLNWWPADACASIGQGAWELVVPLETGQALQPGVQYVVWACQPGGPDVVATFPFDLDGPPPPPSETP